MTPWGRPASTRMLWVRKFAATANGDGFQTTTFPMRAGAAGRLPPIAVKLNGDTA